MSLREAAYRHLLDLLPPGRRPTPGGTADGVVRLLGGLEAQLMEEVFSLAREAFPHRAQDLDRHAQGRMVPRIPPDEGEERFRARVVGAILFWRWAGTRRGLQMALELLGYPVDVVEGPFQNTFDGSWRFDYEGAFSTPAWAEFGLRVWPAGAFRKADSAYLRNIVRELKPAHTILRFLEVYTADGRTLRLTPRALWVVWDLGTFGDFRFGDIHPQPAQARMDVLWYADARRVECAIFGGWEFGSRVF